MRSSQCAVGPAQAHKHVQDTLHELVDETVQLVVSNGVAVLGKLTDDEHIAAPSTAATQVNTHPRPSGPLLTLPHGSVNRLDAAQCILGPKEGDVRTA